VPILPNPTPPDPIPPDSEDELPDAFDPLDLNKDGVVDDNELEFASFINDGTGLHPTPTTYATTTVMQSSIYGDETATPTPSTYHLTYTISQLFEYNKVAGDSLGFNSTGPEWGAYGPHPDYSRIKKTGTDTYQPYIWQDGFRPGYSWDWLSPITGNLYDAICPYYIFMSRGGVFTSSKSLYYFFVEIYNDYQALHGYANFSFARDGLPSPHWPGMIKVVYSNTGYGERPRERSRYEKWFKDHFDHTGAPYMHYEEKLTNKTVPTRFRTIHDFDDTRPTRDEDPGETEVLEDRLEAPPPMAKLTTGLTPGSSAVVVRDTQQMGQGTYLQTSDRTIGWLLFGDSIVIQGWTAQCPTLIDAQRAGRWPMVAQKKAETVNPYNAVIGAGDPQMWYPDPAFNTYSGFLVPGSSSQCVGMWTQQSYLNDGGAIVCSAYGLTSICNGDASVGGNKTALVPSPGGVEGIAKVCPAHTIAFIYDASVGNWGQVTWIAMV